MILCNEFRCRGLGGHRIGLIVLIENLDRLAKHSPGLVDLFHREIRAFRVARAEQGKPSGQRQERSDSEMRLRRCEQPAEYRRR